MKLIVELSFMPHMLVTCGGDSQYVIMPLTKTVATRAWPGFSSIERFGLDEVSTWHFEVWNEMWGVPSPHPYMKLYALQGLSRSRP